MDIKTQNEANESQRVSLGFYSSVTYGFDNQQESPDASQAVAMPDVMQLGKSERLELAVRELRIGKCIHEELKQQGRSVAWLARQLGVERTSLYYTFRQNSIDMELLLRISFLLNYDFFQDIVDVCKSYGLFNNK